MTVNRCHDTIKPRCTRGVSENSAYLPRRFSLLLEAGRQRNPEFPNDLHHRNGSFRRASAVIQTLCAQQSCIAKMQKQQVNNAPRTDCSMRRSMACVVFVRLSRFWDSIPVFCRINIASRRQRCEDEPVTPHPPG